MNNASEIPGIIKNPNRLFLYIQAITDDQFESNFRFFGQPAFGREPQSGGALNEETRIVTPDGRRFYAVSFTGDLEGWQNQVVGYCSKFKCLSGKIVDDYFILSTGEKFILTNCEVAVNYIQG